MTDREDDPLNEVIGAFRRMPVPEAPEAALLFRRPQSQLAMSEPAGTSPSRRFWRFLMRPDVRYGLAATVLLIVFGWLMLGPSSLIALADVIRAAEQHKLVRYKLEMITADSAARPREVTRGTVYVDLVRPRSRFESEPEPQDDGTSRQNVTVQDQVARETVVQSNVSRRVVNEKGEPQIVVQGVWSIFRESDLAEWAHLSVGFSPPGAFVFGDSPEKTLFLDALSALQKHNGTTSAKGRLGGRDVIIFAAKVGTTRSTVWVDPQTKLPLRIEQSFLDGATGLETVRCISTDFVWDPPGADPAALFQISESKPRANEKGAGPGQPGAADRK
jgi:hypothetical protein